jgi:hypothetical protein
MVPTTPIIISHTSGLTIINATIIIAQLNLDHRCGVMHQPSAHLLKTFQIMHLDSRSFGMTILSPHRPMKKTRHRIDRFPSRIDRLEHSYLQPVPNFPPSIRTPFRHLDVTHISSTQQYLRHIYQLNNSITQLGIILPVRTSKPPLFLPHLYSSFHVSTIRGNPTSSKPPFPTSNPHLLFPPSGEIPHPPNHLFPPRIPISCFYHPGKSHILQTDLFLSTTSFQ